MIDKSSTIEQSILRCSKRGMDVLYKYVDANFCTNAARALVDNPRGLALVCTGFCCFGAGETDGPIGAYFIAKTLKKIGYIPLIVTDEFSMSYFPQDADYQVYDFKNLPEGIVEKCSAMISIERCGRAADGKYYNMRGKDISDVTSAIDSLFIGAKCLTIGIGDGGNEIGMGNLKDAISEQLNLEPCVVTVDHLLLATVSNWGAYGLIAALSIQCGELLLPTFSEVEKIAKHIVKSGAVDGVTGRNECTTDGFALTVDGDLLSELLEIYQQSQK